MEGHLYLWGQPANYLFHTDSVDTPTPFPHLIASIPKCRDFICGAWHCVAICESNIHPARDADSYTLEVELADSVQPFLVEEKKETDTKKTSFRHTAGTRLVRRGKTKGEPLIVVETRFEK